MNLLLLPEDAEADIESEENHAPYEADGSHQICGGSVIDGFKYHTSDYRSQYLTGRKEGAVETRPIVTDDLIEGLVFSLSDFLFYENSLECVWQQGYEDEALSNAIESKTNEHNPDLVWQVKLL